MKTYTYKKSQALFERASKVIPCGIYGHYSPAPLVPASDYPFFTAKAKGSRFTDVDGNEFIDYMCAYGPMILGYSHSKVDAAAAKQEKLSSCVTGASPLMVELAEYLTELIDGMDWAFFAKNGGDVTNYAVMVARSVTGRKKIIAVSGGYHGVAPWMQAPGHHGVMEDDYCNVIRVKWNSFEEFENAVKANSGEIAAFISTPYHHPAFADNEMPEEGYWQKIEALCRKEGILLIIDDVRCGFRLDIKGSHHYFGFKPDLVCFCKAIANGYPISALMGTDSLKADTAKVFHTGSYWFQSAPMAAALTTLKELNRINGTRIMYENGTKLLDGMVEIASDYGFNLHVTGHPSMPYLRITDDESLMLHQEWCSECTRRGAYFTSHHNWFISTAHTGSDIKRTWDICHDAFKAIKKRY